MSALIGAVLGAYLAAGAVSKVVHRNGHQSDIFEVLSRRLGVGAMPARMLLGVVELVVALGAAAPSPTRRASLTAQAVLLCAFVLVLIAARRYETACGCFGIRSAKPTVAHLGIASFMAGAGIVLALKPATGWLALIGVAIGVVGGLLASTTARTEGDTRAVDRADAGLTRRALMGRGSKIAAGVAAAAIFGWREATPATAESSGTLRPRPPSTDELRLASTSSLTTQALSSHDIDAAKVGWEHAVAYDFSDADRQLTAVVVPVEGSALFVGHVSPGATVAQELVAILDPQWSGWIHTADRRVFSATGGALTQTVGYGSVINSTEAFGVSKHRCTLDIASFTIAACCAACGFTGPAWGPCCGGCSVGAGIGCLIRWIW